ncbi:FecR family protein [Butyricimonas synergistica]|uniref:FecR family protein n=1 Tax=Butyricimonas synergistica TaxID=544644 RepID=UPI0003633281|nr:FecR family protein [Butyricimonas synergistica]
MSTKDEKEWLRAVLEGKIKPGDKEWKKIWKEEDFARVREVLREVGMMERGEVRFDREKMWRVIEDYRGEGKNRRRVSGAWRWVAAVIIPLCIGGAMWFLSQGAKNTTSLAQVPVLEGGGPRAMLIMAGGERIDLTSELKDTLLNNNGVRVCLDSSRRVTYERSGVVPAKVEYNTIVVPRRGEYQLALTDGTKVYLNSESELRFPTIFTNGERRVYLKGEGYFEVATDTARPFVVEADEIDVRVLGTRFNVNAYTPERMIRTTLVSGKVQVSDRQDGTSAILAPGQQAVWTEGELSTREVNAAAISAWVDGKFYFEEGATLEEISEQLRRWYDIDFFFASERVKHFVFAGVIKKEYTANEIFSIIEKTTGVKFTVNGRVVTVSEVIKMKN